MDKSSKLAALKLSMRIATLSQPPFKALIVCQGTMIRDLPQPSCLHLTIILRMRDYYLHSTDGETELRQVT